MRKLGGKVQLHGVMRHMATDVRTAYLQAATSRKYYITCTIEYGLNNVGKRALTGQALSGGKVAEHDFWHHI